MANWREREPSVAGLKAASAFFCHRIFDFPGFRLPTASIGYASPTRPLARSYSRIRSMARLLPYGRMTKDRGGSMTVSIPPIRLYR